MTPIEFWIVTFIEVERPEVSEVIGVATNLVAAREIRRAEIARWAETNPDLYFDPSSPDSEDAGNDEFCICLERFVVSAERLFDVRDGLMSIVREIKT